ncbi:oxidoreductase-like domain-containing protein [Silvimonas sp.]|uniref:oxidoreductase-like domain-containing protein n=1 Tax=Silvimonas sp. TaxID=2650811 RepID=UPI00284F6451|nr:oxidoreductase-like domain-containing protein [Silvimonas sp.]MDR3428106.1 oxidoreductase-like domain-containing protein [Silvimonas sp.]
MTEAHLDPADPPPQPPYEPALEECCGNGCDPCIFDTYAQALQNYRTELKAWQSRHPGIDVPSR